MMIRLCDHRYLSEVIIEAWKVSQERQTSSEHSLKERMMREQKVSLEKSLLLIPRLQVLNHKKKEEDKKLLHGQDSEEKKLKRRMKCKEKLPQKLDFIFSPLVSESISAFDIRKS
jgi:hypothetical protein